MALRRNPPTPMARILIVEDEASILEMLTAVLETAGHTVATASGGREAIDKHKTWSPDLIISDLVMPEVDGFEILREVKRYEPSIPVIMVSGSDARFLYLQMAGKLGATQTLTKPFTAQQLLDAVEKVVRNRTPRSAP